jgi:hypothetical protein
VFVSPLVVFHGRLALSATLHTSEYALVFQCFSKPVGVVYAIRCPAAESQFR